MNQQNKYPLCEQLKLNIWCNSEGKENWLYASDLEAILQKATVVYGTKEGAYWTHDIESVDTHQALLLNPQPIKEKTTLEKIVEIAQLAIDKNSTTGLSLQSYKVYQQGLYDIKKLIEDANVDIKK